MAPPSKESSGGSKSGLADVSPAGSICHFSSREKLGCDRSKDGPEGSRDPMLRSENCLPYPDSSIVDDELN